MMINIFLISAIVGLSPLERINSDTLPKRITVIGIARNYKNDAIVIKDDSIRYVLDGVSGWSDEYIGKKVRVKGKLILIERKPIENNNPNITITPQRRYGAWRTILKPKWKLVE